MPAQIGPYRVDREIGRGGMGVVYLARDESLGREVAIKCLPDEFGRDQERLERFNREARLLASLNHPNIATVHSLLAFNGRKYLVLEYIDGESLTDYLRQHGRSWRKCLEVASRIADALAAAHARGVAHRDVKPDNVRFTRGGHVKVLDFGLACTVPRNENGGTDVTTVARHTKPGAVMGTPGYMAPEQARGSPADFRSDIFAFGCLLYEMLTGREAFARGTVADSLAATLQEDIDPPSRIAARIPPELDAIVMRCLEKRPDDRYQSARDLAFSLRTVIGAQEPSAGSGPQAPRGSRRHRRPWFIGAALILIAVVAFGTWWLRPEPSPAPRSLAVLPFVDEGADEDVTFLCDGIAESITNRLRVALPELVIAPQALAFQFRGPDVDLDEVARELKVEAIVTGRVMQRDDRLIVRPELTDIDDRRHLWGATFPFNEGMSDILQVEETIATRIAEALTPELSGRQRSQLARSHTENPEAYLAYLNGRFWWRQHWPETSRKALPYFEDAIAADPEFALAYAGIADVYSTKSGFPADVSRREARAAIREAMRLDDSLAEVQTAQGLVNMNHEWDWEAAERNFQRALEIDPGFAWAHHAYGHLLSTLYRYDEAREHFERALELEPRSTDNYVCLGGQYLRMGLYDEAERVLTNPQAMDTRFGLDISSDYLGWSYLRRQRFDEAIAVFERAVEESNRGWYAVSLLATGEAVRGNEDRARTLLEELLRRPRPANAGDEFLAPIYAALGEDDEALEILERVYESRENIWFAAELFRPGFDSLLDDPRFQALLDRMNVPRRPPVWAHGTSNAGHG